MVLVDFVVISGLLIYRFITGCVVPSLYAYNRSTCRGNRCLGYDLLYLVSMPGPEQSLGFVLAGIPVYYITRSNNHDVPRILGEHLTELILVDVFSWRALDSLVFIGWVKPLLARMQGTPPGDGWVAVSTEGDENMEMTEGHR